MSSEEIRKRFLDFFAKRGHKIVPSSSLIPTDPSVLLTTAGMQQFKTYYTGAADPLKDFGSKNVASIQKSFRTSDIDEVGDESHLTFFEMLGNFSFGGYGKSEAIEYAYEFITKDLGLKIDYVSVFEGGDGIEKDEESAKIWGSIGVTDIRLAARADNFWGPTGEEGPCGPTTEIYVDGVEIWNLVFNEYYQHQDKSLKKLATLGVDTGMGLERLAMVVQGKNNIFETDLFAPIFAALAELSSQDDLRAKRIVADHLRAAVFLIADGVLPSNTDRGYVLRRLLRRAVRYAARLGLKNLTAIAETVREKYSVKFLNEIIETEEAKFRAMLARGLKEFERGADPFILFTTYGFPIELTEELAKERGRTVDREVFNRAMSGHQEVSRAGLQRKFAGGLADHDPKTIKLHTAHHLLLAALQSVLGKSVKQHGSNINQERLRLDFSFDRKLTEEEKRRVEDLVNEKIKENLAVIRREMPRAEAEKLGAEMEFGAKYGEIVSVYFIGENPSTRSGRAFSAEFCVGPHVARTGELGKFKILKDEPVAAGLRRIRAVLE